MVKLKFRAWDCHGPFEKEFLGKTKKECKEKLSNYLNKTVGDPAQFLNDFTDLWVWSNV